MVTQARPRRGAHAAPRTAAVTVPSFPMARPRPRHARVLPGPLPAVLLGVAGAGFALLAATGPGPQPAAAPAPAGPLLRAQSAAEPAPLGPRVVDDERASRTRRAAQPDPEPPPAPGDAADVPVAPPAEPMAAEPAAPVLPGCDAASHHSEKYGNGRIPRTVLCELPGGSGEQLRTDAAIAFVRLASGYQQAFGEPICVTDGYRTLGEQQQLRSRKPRLAARPGTSEHGWGLAVDLACGVESFRSERHAWMVDNAEAYGWFHPDWAQRGGSKPEPWHWEYAGS